LGESDPRPLLAGAEEQLPAGSSLVSAELAGHWATRYPFVAGRGEALRLRVVLRPAAAVPDGMVYVPAGRFHYGSDDDEELRAVLTHQPGHDLELPAFLIARTEVTNGAYLAFLASLPEAERARRAAMAGGADLP